MTGTLRVVVLLVALVSMTVAGCGGGAGGDNEAGGGGNEGNDNGGNQGGESVPDMGSQRAEGPPDIDGTWVGVLADSEGQLVMDLGINQEGQELSSYATIAQTDVENVFFAADVGGEAQQNQQFTLSSDTTTFDIEGELANPNTVKATVTVEGGGAFDIELERMRTELPEGLALAAVQAVYSQNWMWIADHASSDLEEDLETRYEDEIETTNEVYDDLTLLVAESYEESLAFNDEENHPTPGDLVTLDEASLVQTENAPDLYLEFDYTTSEGDEGSAYVRLVEAGTSSQGYAFQIDALRVEYETNTGTADISFGT